MSATIRRRTRRDVVNDASAQSVVTGPTIAETLARFLADQERRLSPRTVAQYRDVVTLLQHYLNDYAYTSLDEGETRLYEQLRGARGDAEPEFCSIFGPKHILVHVSMFLS